MKLTVKFKFVVSAFVLSLLALWSQYQMSMSEILRDKKANLYGEILSSTQEMADALKKKLVLLNDDLVSASQNIDEKFLFFNKNEIKQNSSDFENIFILRKVENRISVGDSISHPPSDVILNNLESLYQKSVQSKSVLFDLKGIPFLPLHVKYSKDHEPLLLIGQIRGNLLEKFITQKGAFTTALLDEAIEPVAETQLSNWSHVQDLIKRQVETTTQNYQHFGTQVFQSQGPGAVLAALSPIPGTRMSITQYISLARAMEGVQILKFKSGLLFVAIVSLTLIIFLLITHHLTLGLHQLKFAMEKVKGGDFTVRTTVSTNDDIQDLSIGFNEMTEKISILLEGEKEKARMESELRTAQTVQQFLFPPVHFQNKHFNLDAFYQPAEECGGDLFYYNLNKEDDQLIFFIGDATGHGVPAALLTAAIRSASSIVFEPLTMPLNEAVKIINDTVCSSVKGEVMMTMFVGCLDLTSLTLKFVNASHEAPLIIPQSPRPIEKSDIQFILADPSPRVGQSLESKFEVHEISLNHGDTLFMYTDGLTEMENSQEKMFGERRMVKTILDIANNNKEENLSKTEVIYKKSREFAENTPLKDDLTYFFIDLS